MPNTPKITIIKEFTYRDQPEEWSNTYHFTGTTPANDADWKALAVAIFNSERTCYVNASKLVRAYGYAAGAAQSTAQIDFTVGVPLRPPGTYANTFPRDWASGDQAATLRAKVGVSSTGKKVYIRKYFHGVVLNSDDQDKIEAGVKTALEAHGALMLGGTLPGGATWCAPQGAAGTQPSASQWITTRTLKRRGKRP